MTRRRVHSFGVLLVLIAALAAAYAGEPQAKAQEDVLHVTYYFMPG